jgi:uncharacterized membrane protein
MTTKSTADAAAMTREQAQQRVDQVHAFRAELAQLEAEGVVLLAPDQSRVLRTHHDDLLAQLAQRFDVDRTQAEKQMSLGMRIASLLGAVALSAAVFLFFYRFWGLLSVPVQVVLLTTAPILIGISVEVAARREKTLYFAWLLALVAFASFVLDLSVVASIFNLPPSPGGFLAWAIFAFVFAYTYRLRTLLLLGIGCAGIWLGAVVMSLSGAYWPGFIVRPENVMLAGALALAVSVFHSRRGEASFALIYRTFGWVALLLPIFFLSEWGTMTYLPLSPIAARRCYDVLGFVLGAGVVWLAIRRQWPETVNVGGLFLVLFLCTKLYDWCWDWMPRYLFFLLIAGVAIGLLAVLQRMRGRAIDHR